MSGDREMGVVKVRIQIPHSLPQVAKIHWRRPAAGHITMGPSLHSYTSLRQNLDTYEYKAQHAELTRLQRWTEKGFGFIERESGGSE